MRSCCLTDAQGSNCYCKLTFVVQSFSHAERWWYPNETCQFPKRKVSPIHSRNIFSLNNFGFLYSAKVNMCSSKEKYQRNCLKPKCIKGCGIFPYGSLLMFFYKLLLFPNWQKNINLANSSDKTFFKDSSNLLVLFLD